MGALFGKQKHDNRVSEADRAILALKLQRDKLKMAYKRYEGNLGKEREMARTLLREGRKERALLLLKSKRYQETLMDRIHGQLGLVERMIQDIETAQLNKEVFERLKKGNEALQVLNERFSVEEAQKIMEETQEAAEYQEEISQILATNLTTEDLEKVEEEYEQLANEAAEQMKLPSVPSVDPTALSEEESVAQTVVEKKKRKKEATALEA